MKKAEMMREKGDKKRMVNHGLKGPRCTGKIGRWKRTEGM